MEIPKMIERIYTENDFGRSLATTFSGIIGLISYFLYRDWVIAGLTLIIFFPLIRVIFSALYNKFRSPSLEKLKIKQAQSIYKQLSNEEIEVVTAFANHGGCVLTWSQVNNSQISPVGIESLIQRGLITTSMTADGTRETFVLDVSLFEIGVNQCK